MVVPYGFRLTDQQVLEQLTLSLIHIFIFEAAPLEIRKDKAWIDAYLMITQLGVDVMKNLPQIPMSQYEAALKQYNQLTKRYGIAVSYTHLDVYKRQGRMCPSPISLMRAPPACRPSAASGLSLIHI